MEAIALPYSPLVAAVVMLDYPPVLRTALGILHHALNRQWVPAIVEVATEVASWRAVTVVHPSAETQTRHAVMKYAALEPYW